MADISNADEKVLEDASKKKKKKKRGSRIMYILLGVIILFFLAVWLYLNFAMKPADPTYVNQSEVERAGTQVENKGTKSDSEAYKSAFREEDNERADEAERQGHSSIPRLLGDVEPEKPKPAPEPEPAPPPQPVAEVPQPAPQPIYMPPTPTQLELGRYFNTRYTPGSVSIDTNVTDTAKKRKEAQEPPRSIVETDKEKLVKLGISPGTVLYAVMDIGANSDQPGTPIMARVVSGEYAGAKFMGGFKRMDEKLVLRFNRVVVKDKKGHDQVFSVSGYAINPNDYSPGVSTGVDTHFLERWGGLIASSFLEGFGEAKSRSGTRYSYGNDNNPGMWDIDYDVADEVWIAAGKVGEKLSDKFSNNFDRPPTVTIQPGEAIGILIM